MVVAIAVAGSGEKRERGGRQTVGLGRLVRWVLFFRRCSVAGRLIWRGKEGVLVAKLRGEAVVRRWTVACDGRRRNRGESGGENGVFRWVGVRTRGSGVAKGDPVVAGVNGRSVVAGLLRRRR
ncbi:hypothetical protein HAX54_018506 [Datura stramonium]|uniref:Uncharacterized protein n=1 Tax=Datura stramonium TaxID=4076 RepID=A0ABS8S1A2_DATST|nr:hypothetical protein [Datura stramonium]